MKSEKNETNLSKKQLWGKLKDQLNNAWKARVSKFGKDSLIESATYFYSLKDLGYDVYSIFTKTHYSSDQKEQLLKKTDKEWIELLGRFQFSNFRIIEIVQTIQQLRKDEKEIL